MAKFSLFFQREDKQIKAIGVVDFEILPRIGELTYVEIWTGKKVLFEVASIIHIFDQSNNVGNMFLIPVDKDDIKAQWFLKGVSEEK